jgi:DNA-binding MarR family transcriptional regulator
MTTKPEPPENESGQYAFDGLDRVLHEKARLGILTSLLAHRDGLIFNELRDLCTLTDGNLSRHLSILQEAALIDITKSTKGNRPQTMVTLTADGKQRFLDYLAVLEDIVNRALGTTEAVSMPPQNIGINPV